jgi:tRNA G10  N-methylase Trm11
VCASRVPSSFGLNVSITFNDMQPFCGSGTILLEALDFYQKRIKCVGMDVSRRSAAGAQENARAEGFDEEMCKFHCCDARNFRKKLDEESVDAIVTNMPW